MATTTDNNPASAGMLRTIIDALPLTATLAAIAVTWLTWPDTAASDGDVPPLQPVKVSSAEALQGVFTDAGYAWPADQVPPVSVQSFPNDLAETRTEVKKSLFFRTLLPLVLAENARIEAQREELMAAIAGDLPEDRQTEVLAQLSREYGVKTDPEADATAQTLRARVDAVPPALALAQAAKESGWGTSRFALEGNNLFGEWTWDASQGMTPRNRNADADHFVRRFETLRISVRSYLNNLNRHDAYERFRSLRTRARQAGRDMTPAQMAGGLERYSERGMAYVDEVRAMITTNRLDRVMANVRLTELPERVAQR
ncbi:glucosaminidase domain-containing protein [Spiribacter vilamensis]|uniref:Bax protein n=1 Tax=Spiribacter vilamensis TaxID=531306 RepID=A0A4Q8D2K5_9GAMM|nr:glucosaminidase domain-containing protein [Spiribacter vilamensis]RZU99574.1 Bax protein [Spiribacter vilamensis]TVO61459.1 hypothetical protein FPL09_04895 [Spiribacter vilamensis]